MLKSVLISFWICTLVLLSQGISFSQTPGASSTAAFLEAKGRLICPLKDGKINKGKIFIDAESQQTLGVDIYADNDTVFAVHAGIVVSAFEMGEENFSVVVSHGDYFSVYSGLKSASVSSKMGVKPESIIGIALPVESQLFLLHFEIWQGSDKLLPINWLSCQ